MGKFCIECGFGQPMHAESCPQYVKPVVQSVQEPTQHERLHKILSECFGNDWFHAVKLEVRADNLSWFVFLIEAGIAARAIAMKKDSPNGRLDASAAASLGSWLIDLERLVDQIEGVVRNQQKITKKKK